MWKIGNVEIPNRVVVAPMAGISNAAFRITAKEFGAGLVVCEMISDKGIHFRNKKTLDMLYIDENEHPLSIQIFGGDKDTLVEAAQFVQENTKADIIDINMGCPVNKVIKAEAGAKWLLDPDKVYEMIHAVSSAVDIPVTVKMRTGWDDQHILAIENAIAAEKAGAAAIAMHGRTRTQMYEGKANWEILKEVKQHVAIPFIGNGDVKTPEDAKKMLEYVKADGVMIGRAILGNPWMIHRTTNYLETGTLMVEPTPTEKIKIAKVHLQRLIDIKGEKIAVREFRQHAAYYLKGIPRAAKVKVAINQAEEQQEMINLMDAFAEKATIYLEEKQSSCDFI
ncbi:tRNA dihydrouridine synthase DusB [Melissococcus plutonius]|uniref:tRNA-dihydrouridine synthase n=1 Tax=Melissococcus plutonius (strain ATCC 35311 / DSM 29964 / CIP 104052 / LMG 20360 / NCIMB 702443) TaxID=940190 RepID=F3Y8E3_MELPT|nr:tRNA dihydrouridine synthase DusB [Melissococcus plutonius]AIM24486.1 putative tRNA-dihydrouridine synthase 1 [Melissococcus plutonius S1]KMT25900.1 putative tRNA-dihydrouridine synthase 1 [Melissococcus plutonius]KMT27245.1 putative tRNA-dihydrouridine synthase 1 [Melissococcus plutonius]KMT28346.1 putative tRNA-dihydrouridine synthase 1 [Melissococcus plutonius]KMT30082.1 putative tRNA-dihydrouridine synthase 1 [Melissococcus plutonius]